MLGRYVTLSAARGPGGRLSHKLLNALRGIAGMPDYAAHLEHLHRSHPDRPIPTEREYWEEFLRSRYEDGPTRCC
jgi:uncharacterized short protein YbdD (DUF466 family)